MKLTYKNRYCALLVGLTTAVNLTFLDYVYLCSCPVIYSTVSAKTILAEMRSNPTRDVMTFVCKREYMA